MTESLHIVCPACDSINRVPKDKLGAGGKCGNCQQPLFNGKPLELDGARFQRHLTKNDVPVLVDFWAAWCGPCKVMAPVFAEAASQLEPEVRLVKIDSDREQVLSGQMSIRGIPTLILFRKGVEVGRQSGAMDLKSLLSWVKQHL